ncbi:hypothetical protein ACNJX9_25315 [Bradyrhizobium sp. DASA03076]|uniref:hypothetical protein n=1 Tax=Bradyrhizobium sp. BLXBL-03 TaxID=3395916 RepID=UPI003F72A5A1
MTNSADLLNPKPQCFTVIAGFQNETPQSAGVTILQIAAVFHYADGTQYPVGPVNVNIGSGGDYPLMSDCTGKCCTLVDGSALVEDSVGDTQVVTGQVAASPGKCLVIANFPLEIQTSLPEAQLKQYVATRDASLLYRFKPESP